jgi:hypothetical protein
MLLYYLSPNPCGEQLTPVGGCQEGSDEAVILSHFEYILRAGNLDVDIVMLDQKSLFLQ